MSKVRICLAALGHLPKDLDLSQVVAWPSDVFEFVGGVQTYALRQDADGNDWEYTDKSLSDALPEQFGAEFLLAVTSVPLTDNWYARRLAANRVAFSMHEIADIMRTVNVPLGNAVLRMIYATVLVYKRHDGKLPPVGANMAPFTHDETRGCLFDMNPSKRDLALSCEQPKICDDCIERLRAQRVSEEDILSVQTEINRIKKPLFFRMADWIHTHPVLALLISVVSAFGIGVVSSIVGSAIYAYWLSAQS